MIAVHVPVDARRFSNWQRTAVTRDGIAFRVRPISADDARRELEFIRSLSEESRYNRLMHALREPSAEFVDRLVHVDYCRSMAFVAVIGDGDEEQFIGVARYAADDSSGACEFAVVVADAWQSRGVGTTLMRQLFEYARASGIKRVYGMILANNQHMIQLAHWLGLQTHRAADDARLLVASRQLD